MKPVTKRRGFVSLLAVVFIAVGAMMATYLYAMLSSSINITHDQDMSKQAMLAAESGLDYLNVVLPEITRMNRIETSNTSTDPATVQLLTASMPFLNASSDISGAPKAEIVCSTFGGSKVATITFDPITVYNPDPAHGLYGTATFVTEISNKFEPYLRNPQVSTVVDPVLPEYCVRVTGTFTRGGVITTRTIGMSAEAVCMVRWSNAGFGIVADGTIDLPTSKNGGVYLYDTSFEQPALNRYRYGTAWPLESGGSVVTFDGTEPEASSSASLFDYGTTTLYDKLDNYRGWNTNPPNPAAGTSATWGNVKIAKNTNLVVTGNLTINGIVYMQYPSSITFGDSSTQNQTLTINGAIIWEPAPSDQAAEKKDQTLTLGRYIDINTTDATARDPYLAPVLGANASSTLLNGDIIAAPQTDLVLEQGNDVIGIKRFNGGIHVEDVYSAGSGNVLMKAPTTGGMVINGGILSAEGNVDLRGNTAFCVNPPPKVAVKVDENRYRLVFNPQTYWELQ